MEEIFFHTPGKDPQGIAWDGTSFWIVDGKGKFLQEFSKQGKLIRSLELPFKYPKGIAWSRNNLLISDDESKIINNIRIEDSQIIIISKLNAPNPSAIEFYHLEGLAYDGKYIWCATDAGNSSRIHRIDPQTGSNLLSFYSDSYPRGIATDGIRLWSICYNGDKVNSILDSRKLSNDANEIRKSRVFLDPRLEKINEPQGLTYDGKNLFIIDNKTRTVFKRALTK